LQVLNISYLEIEKSEIETYIKNQTFVLAQRFTKLAPIPKTSNIYFKKQKIEANQKKQPFDDIYFKPEQRNISYIDKSIQNKKFLSKSDTVQLGDYKFAKLSEIGKGVDNFKINSLSNSTQKCSFGKYANINLYNILLYLSENKSWRQNIIIKKDKERMIFSIKLFIQGKQKSIMIDDYFPLNNNNDNFAFISPKEENFWILLIEKALAKIHRSYGNIIRLLSSELIHLLTEIPLIKINHKNYKKSTLWDSFNEAGKRGWLVFSEFESIHLETPITENFISFYVTNLIKINKTKYLELTIPTEINENFSTFSLLEIKERLQAIYPQDFQLLTNAISENKVKSSKLIYMTFDHFFEIFSKTYILKKEEGFLYKYQKFQINPNSFNLVKIKITNKTKAYLTLHLKQSKFYTKSNKYETPISRMFICKLILNKKRKPSKNWKENPQTSHQGSSNYIITNSDQSNEDEDYDISLNYINAIYGREEKLTIEEELTEGTYYLFFKIYSEEVQNVIISSFSDNFIQLEESFDQTDYQVLSSNENLLFNSLISFFNSYLSKFVSYQSIESDPNLQYSQALSDQNFGFSILKFENNTTDKLLTLKIDFENSGMELISHEAQQLSQDPNSPINSQRSKILNLNIPPKNKELLIFEWFLNFNSISLTINPKFYVEKLNVINRLQLDVFNNKNYPKNYITNFIYYYEVTYRRGIFLVIVNESVKEYFIRVIFEKLSNLKICGYDRKEVTSNETVNKLELICGGREVKYIKLRMEMEDSEVSYKINFRINIKSNESEKFTEN
jgi:hypothetical protein